MENNTSTLNKDNTNYYIAGLIELDCYKDEQELIKAEFMLENDNTNTYWIGRVKFLQDKILTKKNLEQQYRQPTLSAIDRDDIILNWSKQLEHKSLSLHELVENVNWLINKIK